MRRSLWDRRWLRRGALAVTLALFGLWAFTPLVAASYRAHGFGVEAPWMQVYVTEGVIRLTCSRQHAGFSAHWETYTGEGPWLYEYYVIRQQPSGIVERVLQVRLAALVVLAWAATALVYWAHGRSQKTRQIRRAGVSSTTEGTIRLAIAALLLIPSFSLVDDLLIRRAPAFMAARAPIYLVLLVPPVVLAYLTGRWFARVISWRAVPDGYCTCGYNLTGNTSGVCPECGTKVSI